MTKPILLLLLIVIGCNRSDDTGSFKNEDVNSYNEQLRIGRLNRQQWTETPLLIINHLLGPAYHYEGNGLYNIEFRKNQNGLIAIVTQEDTFDDSVSGEKRIIEFEYKDSVWSFKSVKVGFKCQKNRGHENYSGDICN
jgi:hypothetical protein